MRLQTRIILQYYDVRYQRPPVVRCREVESEFSLVFFQVAGRRFCRCSRGCRSRLPGAADGSPDASAPVVLLPLAAALLPGGGHPGGQERPEEGVAPDGGGEVSGPTGRVSAFRHRWPSVHGLVVSDAVIYSEKSGACVGNVRLGGPVVSQSEGTFLHRFQRSAAPKGSEGAAVGLSSGERVVVSDQQGHMVALATGYVCEVSRTWVSCTLDR